MILNKKYKIRLACSTDETRYSLNHPIVTDKNTMVATDGRILAVVPVELDKNDKVGYVRREAIEDAHKKTLKQESVVKVDLSNETFIPALSEVIGTYSRTVGEFPKYERIIENNNRLETKAIVTFNIAKLTNLCEALGIKESVTLEIKSELEPIKVTTSNDDKAYGLLMPMKK